MIRAEDKQLQSQLNVELDRIWQAIEAPKRAILMKNADIPSVRQREGVVSFIDSRDDKHYFGIRYNGQNYFACAVKAEDVKEYSVSNGTTDRTFDADEAAGTISASPTQAEVENIRDAVLELADVLGTAICDLQNCGIFK